MDRTKKYLILLVQIYFGKMGLEDQGSFKAKPKASRSQQNIFNFVLFACMRASPELLRCY